jgi:hypothetical protein
MHIVSPLSFNSEREAYEITSLSVRTSVGLTVAQECFGYRGYET